MLQSILLGVLIIYQTTIVGLSLFCLNTYELTQLLLLEVTSQLQVSLSNSPLQLINLYTNTVLCYRGVFACVEHLEVELENNHKRLGAESVEKQLLRIFMAKPNTKDLSKLNYLTITNKKISVRNEKQSMNKMRKKKSKCYSTEK